MTTILEEIVKARKEFRRKNNREPVKLRIGRSKAEDFFLVPGSLEFFREFMGPLFREGLESLKNQTLMGMRIELIGEADSESLEIH